MEKELIEFLNSLSIEDDEIEELVELCPGLEFIDTERAKINVKLIVNAGYPLADISSIIYINPGILINDPTELSKSLIEIGDDLENKLNKNPYLI